MTAGPTPGPKVTLRRLLLWMALVGVWLGVLVDSASDELYLRPWFSPVVALAVGIVLAIGRVLERNFRAMQAHRVEWTLLWIGLGMCLAPLVYRVVVAD
jgi:hypothetical protein